MQDGTALELDGLQLLEIAEMAVDQRRIRERPEVLGRLKLGRVGGQEQQVDILGHRQAVAGVPVILRAILHHEIAAKVHQAFTAKVHQGIAAKQHHYGGMSEQESW